MRMGKMITLMLLVCMIISISTVTTPQCKAQYSGLVVICANGIIEPTNAPIQQAGEVYRLTEDIESIRIERSNIVLDGDGHAVPGEPSSLSTGTSSYDTGVLIEKVVNVTVMNLIVKSVPVGIFLDRTTNCTIINNTLTKTQVAIPELQATAGIYVWGGNSNTITQNQLTGNWNGIYIGYFSEQNLVTKNNITGNSQGIVLYSSNNSILKNNFFSNSVDAENDEGSENFWDNGKEGNYWGSYNGSDINCDGIGDIAYTINGYQQDRYPLMAPFAGNTTDQTSNQIAETEPSLTPFAAMALGITLIVAVSTCVTIYFRNHRHRKQPRTGV